jgi:hypothetical protein
MTPLQLAKAECANYQLDSVCLGAHIADGGATRCQPQPRCALSAGERCPYFEQYVAPLAEIVTEPHRAKAIQAAVHAYRMVHPGVAIGSYNRRRDGQRCGLVSQKPQQGPGLPRQHRQAQNPYEGSHHHQEGASVGAVPAAGSSAAA